MNGSQGLTLISNSLLESSLDQMAQRKVLGRTVAFTISMASCVGKDLEILGNEAYNLRESKGA